MLFCSVLCHELMYKLITLSTLITGKRSSCQCQGQWSSTPKPQFFVLWLSSRSKPVLKDPIPDDMRVVLAGYSFWWSQEEHRTIATLVFCISYELDEMVTDSCRKWLLNWCRCVSAIPCQSHCSILWMIRQQDKPASSACSQWVTTFPLKPSFKLKF